MKKIFTLLIFIIFCSNVITLASGQSQYQRGPYQKSEASKAPEWNISEWMKGPGKSLSDLKGQVVIIDFFQLWCPGCNKFSIPLMAQWEKEFAIEIETQKLTLLSIHTVFEGHSYQTNTRLKEYIKEKNFNHPVGVDNQTPGKRFPDTMIKYRTRGTPEMAFIDKWGNLRFQQFGYFDPVWATNYVRMLLLEK